MGILFPENQTLHNVVVFQVCQSSCAKGGFHRNYGRKPVWIHYCRHHLLLCNNGCYYSYCHSILHLKLSTGINIPYPRERGPTAECPPTPHFGLNFLLRSSVYSNMCPCVAALENAAQMAGLRGLNFVRSISNVLNSRKNKPS